MSKRAVYAVLAWAAATTTAMGVVWAGLDSVLPTATAGPHVATIAVWPVQDAASAGSATTSVIAPGTTVTSAGPSPTAGRTASPVGGAPSAAAATSSAAKTAPSVAVTTSAASTATATATASSGTERQYVTAGGTAVLTLYANSATFDEAIPAAGFSARTWTNTDMLEVEFSPSDAGTVYEVIATWNGTSPQVSTYAVGG